MSFEEVWNSGIHISASIAKEEGEVLYNQVLELPENSLIVEIGSYVGRSTHVLASTAKLSNSRVIAIDPFLPSFDGWHHSDSKTAFMENVMRAFDNVQLIEDYSQNVVDKVPEFDFIFIDGDHSFKGVLADCKNYLPKLRSGGCASFHDYSGSWAGVQKAVNKYCREWEKVNNVWSIATRRKP